jgi:hypothetical protein
VTNGNTSSTVVPRNDFATEAGADWSECAKLEPLLNDLRVLLLFVAVYQPRLLAAYPTGSNPHAILAAAHVPSAPEPFSSTTHIPLLGRTPAAVAADPNLLDQLYESLATLSARAAPASAESIQLTAAFARVELGLLPPGVIAFARRLRRWFIAMAVIGFAAFALTIMLLVHTDQGRQAIRQLQALELRYNQTTSSISDVSAARASTDGEAPCRNVSLPAAGGVASARLQALCAELDDLGRRRSIIKQELRAWNAISYHLDYLTSMRWLAGQLSLPAGLSEEDWTGAELRTSAMMSALTGIVLPMLLGLLGACAYVFRDLDRHIRTWTLYRGAAWHSALRLLLGVMLGGLLSVFWSSGTAPRVDGVALSLAAVAFFVGFGVEIVFQTLDTMIAAVAGKIAK